MKKPKGDKTKLLPNPSDPDVQIAFRGKLSTRTMIREDISPKIEAAGLTWDDWFHMMKPISEKILLEKIRKRFPPIK